MSNSVCGACPGKPEGVASAARRSSGVAPRACVLCARARACAGAAEYLRTRTYLLLFTVGREVWVWCLRHAGRRSSGVAPRACVCARACAVVPPNVYIYYIQAYIYSPVYCRTRDVWCLRHAGALARGDATRGPVCARARVLVLLNVYICAHTYSFTVIGREVWCRLRHAIRALALSRGPLPLLCARRVRACAGAAESLHTYIQRALSAQYPAARTRTCTPASLRLYTPHLARLVIASRPLLSIYTLGRGRELYLPKYPLRAGPTAPPVRGRYSDRNLPALGPAPQRGNQSSTVHRALEVSLSRSPHTRPTPLNRPPAPGSLSIANSFIARHS